MGCLIVFDGKEIGRGRNNANEDKNATKDSVQVFFEKNVCQMKTVNFYELILTLFSRANIVLGLLFTIKRKS